MPCHVQGNKPGPDRPALLNGMVIAVDAMTACFTCLLCVSRWPNLQKHFSNAVRSTVAAQADMRSWSGLVSRCITSSASFPRIESCCSASCSSRVEHTSSLPKRVAALALTRSGLLSREPTSLRSSACNNKMCISQKIAETARLTF